MTILQLMNKKNLTRYKLSKQSGVPQTTINDICSGKARIEKCSAETLYKMSKVLGVTMEDLIEPAMKDHENPEYRIDFESYKSNVCHSVKDKGDLGFLMDTLKSDEIRTLFEKKWYPEALYLLAMVDYLSRENDIPLCSRYEDLRSAKLRRTVYPASVIVASLASKSNRFREDAMADSIPEFLRYNIVEGEVRNVC